MSGEGEAMENVITASIVTHGTDPRQLLTALECILRCGEVTRVYVIDNSENDSLRSSVEGMERVNYVHVANRGYGAGHNVAIRRCLADGSRYHLVMNADVRWDGDVLTSLLAFMEGHPDVGQLSPKIYYPDGTLQYACRMLPTPWDLFAKRFLPERLTRRRMERYMLADADHDRQFDCPYLLGSFMLFRGDALREVGLFDERFFMYPEDIDITRRIHERYRTLYCPKVSIIHDHAAASRKSLKMLKIHMVNMVRYFNKWGWWFDSGRRKYNRELVAKMPRVKGPCEPGRG